MPLNSKQLQIKEKLTLVSQNLKSQQIVFRTEWLGFIPFGVYAHVECGGHDISKELPKEWELSDLIALASEGHLKKVKEWKNPNDENESQIVFELKAS